MSIDGRMDKPVVLHWYNGLLGSNENESSEAILHNISKSLKSIVEGKKPDTKNTLLCDSTYTSFKNRPRGDKRIAMQ